MPSGAVLESVGDSRPAAIPARRLRTTARIGGITSTAAVRANAGSETNVLVRPRRRLGHRGRSQHCAAVALRADFLSRTVTCATSLLAAMEAQNITGSRAVDARGVAAAETTRTWNLMMFGHDSSLFCSVSSWFVVPSCFKFPCVRGNRATFLGFRRRMALRKPWW